MSGKQQGFGAPIATSERGTKKSRRHPLTGHGPIVDRARAALKLTAAQFGEVVHSDQTSVRVRAADGFEITLSYEGGNFVFSRVYGLTISAVLPAESSVPGAIELSHRDKRGPRFVPKRAANAPHALAALNQTVGDSLRAVDLVSAKVTTNGSSRTLSLTPMGGSFVWVLIPPVFKATAFPAGEPDRLLHIIREMRGFAPLPA